MLVGEFELGAAELAEVGGGSVQAGKGGTGDDTGGIDIALPMEAGNDTALTVLEAFFE